VGGKVEVLIKLAYGLHVAESAISATPGYNRLSLFIGFLAGL